jgi:WD40 repeat protein/tRNA A-37 threonylcarbamoyl transferase component Bud32
MAVFEKALSVEGAARERVLAVECAGDAGLRKEVESMLGHAAAPAAGLTAGGGMAPSVAGRIIGKASMESASRALIPLLKGEYRIIETVGHGGMGVVYRAEQTIPKRMVAIKAIRPGLTSRQVLRRFEHEAHILGRLQHPGIAQVYEAGAASSARADEAFFVMEFVDGTPITEYSRSAGLDVRAKVEIVAKVCDAVQHAHQRRVIHRDLKPANILVTRDGQPKILDFGVARLESSDDTASITRQTHVGQLIGTLAYMAPEQLEGAEVDVRADVYAMGVVLYQLLTGKLPHDFKGSSLLEAAALLREDEPARVARADPSLRGDIDIIVQKATERDRERRYQSASDLAMDLRRHLKGEPIQARADSAVYVIRKQLSRHKGVTAAIAAALVGLAGFAVYASVQSAKQATARQQSDANAARYRAELSVTNVERGRLLGLTGNFPAADNLIWSEHATAPSDLSYWALWELYSKMPTRATLGGHPSNVRQVAASADGTVAATVSESEIHLWKTATWERVRVLSMDSEVRAARLTPDGALVVATGVSGDTGVWRVATGERVGGSKVDRAYGTTIAATGAAPWPVAVMGRDSAVHLFQLSADGTLAADGDIALPPRSSPAEFDPMAINPSRTMLAAGFFDGAVRAWRLDTRELVWDNHEHVGIVGGMTFSPDGATLVTGAQDRAALFYDVSGYTITASPKNHILTWENGTIRSLSYSEDGRYIAAAGYWYTEVWDAATRTRLKEFTRAQEPGLSAVWLGHDSVILATGKGPFARVWDAHSSGHLRRIQAHGGGAWCVVLSPGADFLATGGNSGEVRLWKWPSMEPVMELPPHHGRVRVLAFSNDGKTLASAGGDGVIKLWDMESRHCRLTMDTVRHEYYTLTFSPDDTSLLTTCRDDAVRVFDVSTGDLKSTVRGTPGGFVTATYSPDGSRIAVTHGHVLSVWDASLTGSPVDLNVPASSGWTVQWLDKPGMLAEGTWDGAIELFQLPKPEPIRTLTGHTQILLSLCLGPSLRDGNRALVSSSMEGVIKLWNPGTGTCLLTLNPEAGAVAQIVATPDGRTLISAHEDGTLGVWDLGYYEPHIGSAAGFHEPGMAAP